MPAFIPNIQHKKVQIPRTKYQKVEEASSVMEEISYKQIHHVNEKKILKIINCT